jgi:ketosteroid isomerase-like protein
VVAVSWADREGRRQSWAHVLKLKGGKIVDIQDYASTTHAAAATRLRAVFG